MFNLKHRAHGCVLVAILILSVFLSGCGDKDQTLNNPYRAKDKHANIYYSAFAERPKTLDPARSYTSNETLFTSQIYEPPLQYHYLKRPYTLVPLTATQVPQPIYLDANGKVLPEDAPANKIATSVYEIKIKPDIFYQPHPAFAKDERGNYVYHKLKIDDLAEIDTLSDFKRQGTRRLLAEDYVYQIKRLAHPELQSPIFGLMSKHIVGMQAYAQVLREYYDEQRKQHGEDTYLDLRAYDLAGVEVVDANTYRIKIKGKYPQILYWLAMPFFAPIPWEADYFYSQPGMQANNISFDWFPVGTGPYMLSENNPNRRMVLSRNPNYHGDTYPTQGEEGDAAQGLLQRAGQSLPFIDSYVFSLEKETIPRWNKFLQGYYDQSAISSDSFEQSVKVGSDGQAHLTPEMRDKGIRLNTSTGTATYYYGFNMLDEVVGGNSARARLLRRAISIALDQEEYISIFLNGRGIPAQGPLPPGIFGYREGEAGANAQVYEWHNDKAQRKTLAQAKQLLAQAGYPDGRDAKTGEPLVLNYDTPASSGPDDKARLEWMRKQFDKLGIQLNVRATQYNRFQEKMRSGNAQIFSWGWLADYPDPENFLFLLYGPNGKVKFGGENASNYTNKKFDRLFEKMRSMPNGPQRQAVIDEMLELVRYDAPWVWGFHPQNFSLTHAWLSPTKPNEIANNTLKYLALAPKQRAKARALWNSPIFWPLGVGFGIFVLALVPVGIRYWRKEHRPLRKKKLGGS